MKMNTVILNICGRYKMLGSHVCWVEAPSSDLMRGVDYYGCIRGCMKNCKGMGLVDEDMVVKDRVSKKKKRGKKKIIIETMLTADDNNINRNKSSTYVVFSWILTTASFVFCGFTLTSIALFTHIMVR